MRVINLDGPDGNAFALLGYASQWAKDLELNKDKILNEMKSDDYVNLVSTFNKYFGMPGAQIAVLQSDQDNLQEIIHG